MNAWTAACGIWCGGFWWGLEASTAATASGTYALIYAETGLNAGSLDRDAVGAGLAWWGQSRHRVFGVLGMVGVGIASGSSCTLFGRKLSRPEKRKFEYGTSLAGGFSHAAHST